MRNAFIVGVITYIVPIIAAAQIQFSEVAWMGTPESQFGEWIEFYNDSDEEIDLAGWKLYEGGGETLVFTFTKTISAKGYLVLERTTGSTPDPLPEINDEAGPFGGSGLSNSGESLVLKNTEGDTLATLSAASGWPAGDSGTKETMQWNGSSWVTAAPTPKLAPLGNSPTSGGDAQGSPAPLALQETTKEFKPSISMIIPETIHTNVTYDYTATTTLSHGRADYGYFVWNMGDGTVYKDIKPLEIRHQYEYPGTYMITFGYFKNPYDTKPFLISSIKKKVEDATILVRIEQGKGIVLTNNTKKDIDLSRWIIKSEHNSYTIPELSFLSVGSSVLIPFTRIGYSFTTATLMTPSFVSIASTIPSVVKVVTSTPQQAPSRTSSLNTDTTVISTPAAESSVLAAEALTAVEENTPLQKRYTKTIFFGIAFLIVIGLFLLLERTMAKGE